MLSDTLMERSGFRYPNGASQDTMLTPFRRRLKSARKFVFAKDAVAMAANVGLSRPTSIVAALAWVRLRADPMWIEFSNADLRQAMTDMGSPNLRAPNTVVEIVRSGFLISQSDDGSLIIEYAHSDKTPQGIVLTDLAPVKLTFDLSDQELPRITTAMKPSVRGVSGKVRRHIELVSKDPKEAAAGASLRDRFEFSPHPDLAPAAAFIESVNGATGRALIEQNQADEAWRLFSGLCLPGLILLQCKNAVDTELSVPSAKLNKTRQAKGREPLHSYETVTMHLTKAVRQRQAASGGSLRSSALVAGHFKVRKTGVFWWHDHLRSGYGDDVKPKTVIVRM